MRQKGKQKEEIWRQQEKKKKLNVSRKHQRNLENT